MGLRPYTFASGDQIKGATPARTIASVVLYDAEVIEMSRYSASGRYAAF